MLCYAQWRDIETASHIIGKPAIGEGIVYFASFVGHLYAAEAQSGNVSVRRVPSQVQLIVEIDS